MDLKNELKKRVDVFNIELEKYLENGRPKILYDAARHLPMAGGKRLRPAISMLACEAVSGDVKQVMPLAVSLELIHNFTLEPTAIIAGDLLFAKAFEIMHDFPGDPTVFKKLDSGLVRSIREVCEGQQLDMEFEKRHNVSEKEYLEMIRKKTSALFIIAAEGGALAGGGATEEVKGMNAYGEFLGLAFQIRDDYLDMSSDEETLGKDIGNDIRNGKKTLIAVHSLNNAPGDDKKLLENIFGNRDASERDVKKVYDLFEELGSVEYAKNTALEYSDRAKKALDTLRNSDAKQVLIKLAEYSIKREK